MESRLFGLFPIIFLIFYARSIESQTLGESFDRSQNCSSAERNKSCEIFCNGFPASRCAETLPKNERIACICYPVNQRLSFSDDGENKKQNACPSVLHDAVDTKMDPKSTLPTAACDNKWKKKCDIFCTSVSRRFENCVIGGNPALNPRACVCRQN